MRSLLMGLERSVVAQQFCRTDRVVRLWIEMFNVGGIDALTTKGPAGRGRRVKLERLRDLLVPVLENPRQAGELHWTGVKLHGYLKEQLGLEVGYSTTVRYLHELGYNLRVPRPWPERQNEEQRNAFLDQLRHGKPIAGLELWFADECGVEGDPRPRRRWSARGGRPKVPYLGDHIRANVIGAVCPASGECCTMIFDGVDTDVFQYYLDFLAEEIPPLDSKRRLLIVDNASWHKAQRLNRHHFEVHYLPGYSPDQARTTTMFDFLRGYSLLLASPRARRPSLSRYSDSRVSTPRSSRRFSHCAVHERLPRQSFPRADRIKSFSGVRLTRGDPSIPSLFSCRVEAPFHGAWGSFRK